jgi:hypothetical protein
LSIPHANLWNILVFQSMGFATEYVTSGRPSASQLLQVLLGLSPPRQDAALFADLRPAYKGGFFHA